MPQATAPPATTASDAKSRAMSLMVRKEPPWSRCVPSVCRSSNWPLAVHWQIESLRGWRRLHAAGLACLTHHAQVFRSDPQECPSCACRGHAAICLLRSIDCVCVSAVGVKTSWASRFQPDTGDPPGEGGQRCRRITDQDYSLPVWSSQSDPGSLISLSDFLAVGRDQISPCDLDQPRSQLQNIDLQRAVARL